MSRLGLAWYYDLPSIPGGNDGGRQEGTPLVHNGILYSITPWSIVYAVDAHTGKEVWHSDPEVNRQITQGRICCGVCAARAMGRCRSDHGIRKYSHR